MSKLYYIAWPESTWAAYQSAFRKLISTVDGVERQAVPWPDWAITTVIDTRQFWSTVWRAISCHESQVAAYERLKDLSPEHHEALWGWQSFYRVFSTVNGGRARETDLFEGIRSVTTEPAAKESAVDSDSVGSAARDGRRDVPRAGTSTRGSARGVPRIAAAASGDPRRIAVGGARRARPHGSAPGIGDGPGAAAGTDRHSCCSITRCSTGTRASSGTSPRRRRRSGFSATFSPRP